MRRFSNSRKVGHLGTLDPMATGVLPLVIGRATRLAQFMTTGEKKYDARIKFGCSTDTYDREGTPASAPVAPHFQREVLEEALQSFRGTFLQTPPPFSAKKIAGTPAYRMARKQIEVVLEPVEVNVLDLELVEFDGTTARVLIHCAAGTYVRSIAHDAGQKLGCGAFLDSLRRTASGDFSVENAYTLEKLHDLAAAGSLEQALIPAATLIPEFPNATVDATTAGQIRQGKDFRLSPFVSRGTGKFVKAIGPEGDLIAIGEARMPHLYHPILVL